LGGSSAEGAEGGGRAEGESPPHWTRGLRRGPCPLLRIFFDFFYLKMVSFGAFWVALPRCMLFRATAQCRQKRKAW